MRTKLTWNGAAAAKLIAQSAQRAGTATEAEIVADLKDMYSHPGSGRIRRHRTRRRRGRRVRGGGNAGYTDLKKASRHSAPGEPPAPDNGHLRRSVRGRRKRLRRGFHSAVGPNAAYAAPLEYGAPSRNLAPRPAVRPVWNKQRKKYKRIFADEMRAGMSKGLDV